MTILVKREVADAALHLSKNLSYRIFAPTPGASGRVSVRRVVNFLRNAGRNGAKCGDEIPTDLLGIHEVADATGFSVRKAIRTIKRAPHFALSRKCLLMHRSDLEDIFA